LALIWNESEMNRLKSKINYYTQKGDLIRLRNGLFSKDKNYNLNELAVSIYTPSYISFETALRKYGMIFQYYESVFVASYSTREIKCDYHNLIYRKLKNILLYNTEGLLNKGTYMIADKERAFLDMIYLFQNYYFDNLHNIDWQKCFNLVKIYENKSLIKRLNTYYKNAK
jgi:predicted transcriptional regulator of viral defense system